MFRTLLASQIVTVMISSIALTLCTASLRADRPGSYDGVISVNPPRAIGPRHPVRRGPLRRGYGWPHRHSSVNFFVGVGPGFVYPPVLGYPLGYPSWNFSYYSGPHGIYYNPAANYAEYYLPPSYFPAELAYGPAATARFLGPRPATPPAARLPVAPPGDPVPGDPIEPVSRDARGVDIASRLRKSNDAAQERAQRFLSFGDSLFLKQRYHEALQRYKSAIEAAPDLAEAYYRQGFALITVNQYKLATKAFRIAIELQPELVRDKLHIDMLFGDHQLAKTSHLEKLARAALENPEDGDLVFLVAMYLHADGEVERARRFFHKAVELAGGGAQFLNPFLGPAPDARSEPTDTALDI